MRERFRRLRGYTKEVLEIKALQNEEYWTQEKGIPELCIEFYNGVYTVLEGGEPVQEAKPTKVPCEAWLIYRTKLKENLDFHRNWDGVQDTLSKNHPWAPRNRNRTPNTVTDDLWT